MLISMTVSPRVVVALQTICYIPQFHISCQSNAPHHTPTKPTSPLPAAPPQFPASPTPYQSNAPPPTPYAPPPPIHFLFLFFVLFFLRSFLPSFLLAARRVSLYRHNVSSLHYEERHGILIRLGGDLERRSTDVARSEQTRIIATALALCLN